jgi:hypothetical protein
MGASSSKSSLGTGFLGASTFFTSTFLGASLFSLGASEVIKGSTQSLTFPQTF